MVAETVTVADVCKRADNACRQDSSKYICFIFWARRGVKGEEGDLLGVSLMNEKKKEKEEKRQAEGEEGCTC